MRNETTDFLWLALEISEDLMMDWIRKSRIIEQFYFPSIILWMNIETSKSVECFFFENIFMLSIIFSSLSINYSFFHLQSEWKFSFVKLICIRTKALGPTWYFQWTMSISKIHMSGWAYMSENTQYGSLQELIRN